MSEHDEQCALFEWAHYQYPELLRWMFAIPNGGLRNKATAVKMKNEGVRAGVSDIFCPIPRGCYHGLFLEMKVGHNKLTDLQKEFQNYATQQGYCCKVAYSADEAIKIIDEYLELNNDRSTC
jgi:hypothetical protein